MMMVKLLMQKIMKPLSKDIPKIIKGDIFTPEVVLFYISIKYAIIKFTSITLNHF